VITELALSPGHPVSLRKQLAAQIGAAIRSGELDTGRRLPSGRRLAELLGLHRHTVHAAYADLARLGLVHRSRRSGVFVRPCVASGDSCPGDIGSRSLEAEFAEFLRAQRCRGRSASDLNRLMGRWAERSFERGIVVVEPEPALRELISAEIAAELPDVEVTGSSWCRARRSPNAFRGSCLVTRHEVATRSWGFDPAVADLIVLRTASVGECRRVVRALDAGQVATLLTSSRLLRRYARELFAGDLGVSVGLACPKPGRRSDLDRALRISSLVLADLITPVPKRPSVPAFAVRAVRVVDRGWIRELARYIGVGPRTWKKGPPAELERLRGIG
jgi:DNA-binding transcriptional regulator YhcF (GntR family)